MMRQILKYTTTVLLFFLCAITQVSLLPYVSIMGVAPNLLFVVFFATLFFQKKQDIVFSFFVVTLAGFLLDMITPLPFGVSIVMLLMMYGMYRWLTRFLREADANIMLWYYLATFLGLFFAYDILLYLASRLVGSPVSLGASTLIALAYSVVLAAAVFFVCQQLFGKAAENNQLKLL